MRPCLRRWGKEGERERGGRRGGGRGGGGGGGGGLSSNRRSQDLSLLIPGPPETAEQSGQMWLFEDKDLGSEQRNLLMSVLTCAQV